MTDKTADQVPLEPEEVEPVDEVALNERLNRIYHDEYEGDENGSV